MATVPPGFVVETQAPVAETPGVAVNTQPPANASAGGDLHTFSINQDHWEAYDSALSDMHVLNGCPDCARMCCCNGITAPFVLLFTPCICWSVTERLINPYEECSSASGSRSLIATDKAVGFLRSSSQRRLASDEASQGVGLRLLIR